MKLKKLTNESTQMATTLAEWCICQCWCFYTQAAGAAATGYRNNAFPNVLNTHTAYGGHGGNFTFKTRGNGFGGGGGAR